MPSFSAGRMRVYPHTIDFLFLKRCKVRVGNCPRRVSIATCYRLDEPKNSDRRVALAFEVEFGLKVSSERGGSRVNLPLKDRSLRIIFDWFQ